MKVKLLALVNGDEYENVELVTEISIEIESIMPGQFIGVKTNQHTIYLQKEFIASLQLEKNLRAISS